MNYKKSNVMKFYLKFFVYYGLLVITNTLLIPILLIRPGDVRNCVIVARACSYINRILGVTWEVRNKENLRNKKACIIVANHQSALDILGLHQIWPLISKGTVVAKKELFYLTGPIGIVFWLCGVICVNRRNADKARSDLNAVARRLKEDDTKLVIFPEGTRRNNGKVNPFRKGAFHMAVNTNLDIMPVVFSSQYFLETKKRFESGKVIITALPAISTDGASVDEVMDKTFRVMHETFQASSSEIFC
ncbi:1-acyl-sn-glycerol-3-phosphate acyltransferase alpha-like [Cotesia typhae]|uniref:1-acyl-sn-glycerol-3-phosphate acyltransferase alpha-like n=1 Tax=Cotesia typhae TaxID=2053667 RepID=UPI003D69077A